MQRHTMTEIVNHSRSTALERSVKTFRGGGGGRGVDWAGRGVAGLKSILHGHNPRPYFCRGIHKTVVQYT